VNVDSRQVPHLALDDAPLVVRGPSGWSVGCYAMRSNANQHPVRRCRERGSGRRKLCATDLSATVQKERFVVQRSSWA